MEIYIACGLSHVPRSLFDDYVAFIHDLARSLQGEREGRSVKYALVDSDPQLAKKPEVERARLCYLWDREMVESCDLLVAEASFPSTGLGVELQIAAANETPIILCFRDFGTNQASPVEYQNPDCSRHQLQLGRGYVSIMALGIPSIFRVVEYSSVDDGCRQVKESVDLLEKPRSVGG